MHFSISFPKIPTALKPVKGFEKTFRNSQIYLPTNILQHNPERILRKNFLDSQDGSVSGWQGGRGEI